MNPRLYYGTTFWRPWLGSLNPVVARSSHPELQFISALATLGVRPYANSPPLSVFPPNRRWSLCSATTLLSDECRVSYLASRWYRFGRVVFLVVVLNQICCLCSEDISVVQSRGKRVYSPFNQRFSFLSDCIYVRKIGIASNYICSLLKSVPFWGGVIWG